MVLASIPNIKVHQTTFPSELRRYMPKTRADMPKTTDARVFFQKRACKGFWVLPTSFFLLGTEGEVL
jgi:hypothetical protein